MWKLKMIHFLHASWNFPGFRFLQICKKKSDFQRKKLSDFQFSNEIFKKKIYLMNIILI
jgi:hypothetical protein